MNVENFELISKVKNFVAVDIETTGLDISKDSIIEISAVKFENRRKISEFESLISANTVLSGFISDLTGINDSMLKNAPPKEEVIPKFLSFIGNSLVAVHNADFDIPFIVRYCQMLRLNFDNVIIDTLDISRKLLKLKKNNLQSVAKFLNIEAVPNHRAKQDALVCAQIFLCVQGRIIKRFDSQSYSGKEKKISEARCESDSVSDNSHGQLSFSEELSKSASSSLSGKNLSGIDAQVSSVHEAQTGKRTEVTVSQLNRYIKRLLDKDTVLSGIWVSGEISNYKKQFSGHLYFSLKDEGGLVRAVMFKQAAAKLDFQLEDGMKVVVYCKVSSYERDGQYQLYVTDIESQGTGSLYVAFEQLKKKLFAEGLFSPQKKKPLPKIPRVIGVITSPTGAAVRDIINVATRRFPLSSILIYPVAVQGDEAPGQIVEALSYFSRRKNTDVIILGRGGGSIEELWAFNEEAVARAVFACEIPVVSAVGHETDVTICDFVADLRAPTPSAAAELCVPSASEAVAYLKNAESRIIYSVTQSIKNKSSVLQTFTIRKPEDVISNFMQRVDNLYRRLSESIEKATLRRKNYYELVKGKFSRFSAVDSIALLRQKNHLAANVLKESTEKKIIKLRGNFEALAGRLASLSPLDAFKRGYSMTTAPGGQVLTSIESLKKGDAVNIRLSDGSVGASITEISKNLV